jgi:hypothetical protein
MQATHQQPGHQKPQNTPQSGQGLVELALVIPVLVIIVVGALDLGRVFFSVITVTNVAREGARYLTLHPDDRRIVTDNPVCYDLEVLPPEPKPAYYCTMEAARQEAYASLGAPLVVDPDEITITPFCLDGPDDDAICDRRTEAYVTAIYQFHPITLWFLPDALEITRTTKMMVP